MFLVNKCTPAKTNVNLLELLAGLQRQISSFLIILLNPGKVGTNGLHIFPKPKMNVFLVQK